MKTIQDPRHHSRIIALQKLYALHFTNNSVNIVELENQDLLNIDDFDRIDERLIDDLVTGVESNIKEIDAIITKNAPQWPIDQIKKVDLEILRIAIFEGFISDTTPKKVAIDEAIELGKEFGGETSSKFINGVLGAIYERSDKN